MNQNLAVGTLVIVAERETLRPFLSTRADKRNGLTPDQSGLRRRQVRREGTQYDRRRASLLPGGYSRHVAPRLSSSDLDWPRLRPSRRDCPLEGD